MKTSELVPGKYMRTWAGYTVEVEVKQVNGRLIEIVPSGYCHDVSTMPNATWEPVQPARATT